MTSCLLVLLGLLAFQPGAAWQRQVMTPKAEWVDTPEPHSLAYFTQYPMLRDEGGGFCSLCTPDQRLAEAKKREIRTELHLVGTLQGFEVYDLFYRFECEGCVDWKSILVKTGPDLYRESTTSSRLRWILTLTHPTLSALVRTSSWVRDTLPEVTRGSTPIPTIGSIRAALISWTSTRFVWLLSPLSPKASACGVVATRTGLGLWPWLCSHSGFWTRASGSAAAEEPLKSGSGWIKGA
jgi:hypothetical protein